MNRAEYEFVINKVGVPAELHQAKPPKTVLPLDKVGIASPRRTTGDEELVNAYGVGVRIITIKESSVSFEPEKFDYVNIGMERLVFELVQPVREPGSGAVIGFRCIVKGK